MWDRWGDHDIWGMLAGLQAFEENRCEGSEGVLMQNECEHSDNTTEIRSQMFSAIKYSIYCDDSN